MAKRIIGALMVVVALGAMVWTSMVVNYEPQRGTDNTVLIAENQNISGSASDLIASLNFTGKAEPLAWSSLEISISVGEEVFPCGFGSQSVKSDASQKVQPKLGVDGVTFTTVVDATDDASFTYFHLPSQSQSNETNYTMRFSKTDVFFGSGVRWTFFESTSIESVDSVDDEVLSNDTEQRLEWYDYDLAVHRVNPKEGVYVIETEDSLFKIQFVSYYNSEDETRYPTMLIRAFNDTTFPALNDPLLVSPSPCLVIAGDDDLLYWNATETIELVENDVQIVTEGQTFEILVAYESQDVNVVLE